MLKLLDKDFLELGSLDNITQADVTKQDSGSWSVSATVVQDGALVNQIKREHYIEYDDQKFFIQDVSLERDGEKRTISFTTEHVFFELEGHVITTGYQFTGTLKAHIERLLEHQQGGDFYYEQGLSESHEIYTIRRTISITSGTLAGNLKTILQHFNARLILDNYAIKPIPRLYAPDSGVVLEYSVTNRNISRTYNRNSVITRLVVKAQIGEDTEEEEALELTKTYGDDGDYRNGITRYMDFGQMDSVSDMDWLAGEYLDVYSNPDASYELDFAELKRLSNIDELYPERDFIIDTGVGVMVLDTDLGINKLLPVKSYSYSLVDDAAPSHITLGSFRVVRMLDEDRNQVLGSMQAENAVVKWAETVMAYVHGIFGGTIRDVDAGLLLYTTPSPSVGRKTLRRAAQRLASITPDYNGTKYNAPFTIVDPVAEIKRKDYWALASAYREIKRYIQNTTGGLGDSVSSVVDLINAAYRAAYGQTSGQTVSYPDDTGDSIFGDDYEARSQELYYASRIVDTLNSRVGNLSEIFLELGGGNGGAIGAINNLYRMLRSHNIKVSADMPDDSVGKEGDLWFKFDKDEE